MATTENKTEGKRLSDAELLEVEKNPRCRKSWTVLSLLATIAADREEHRFVVEAMTGRVGELTKQVQWFEETYNERAYQPVCRKRVEGVKCPHCGVNGARHIGIHWTCFDCGKIWEETVE